MKRYSRLVITTFITIACTLVATSCSSNAGSFSAMNSRYNSFLKILPNDLEDAFKIDSQKYADTYKLWQEEANLWIDNIMLEENNGVKNIEAKFVPDTKDYAIGVLTNRFYERRNPYELMDKVYAHTKNLGHDIAQLEKTDQDFSNKLHRIKIDEAIENFNSEETAFYYLWNYTLMLERPRRFQ